MLFRRNLENSGKKRSVEASSDAYPVPDAEVGEEDSEDLLLSTASSTEIEHDKRDEKERLGLMVERMARIAAVGIL